MEVCDLRQEVDDAKSVTHADFAKCETELNETTTALHVDAPAPDGAGACGLENGAMSPSSPTAASGEPAAAATLSPPSQPSSSACALSRNTLVMCTQAFPSALNSMLPSRTLMNCVNDCNPFNPPKVEVPAPREGGSPRPSANGNNSPKGRARANPRPKQRPNLHGHLGHPAKMAKSVTLWRTLRALCGESRSESSRHLPSCRLLLAIKKDASSKGPSISRAGMLAPGLAFSGPSGKS